MRIPLLQALFSPRALLLAGWGAMGGVLGFFLGLPCSFIFGFDSSHSRSAIAEIVVTGLWTAFVGVGIGVAILAGDNILSLRGRWQRDLQQGAVFFAVLGAISGSVAQMFYEPAMRMAGVGGPINPLNPAQGLMMLMVSSLVRGAAWAMLGAGLGIGLGVLRRDWKAGLRGAIGGVVGGYHGGAAFDMVALLLRTNDGNISRFLGIVITGAAIAWCIRVAQEALQTAWLLGVSTGPYEGKECPLNKDRISVGRGEENDIALYRDETVPSHLGHFVFQSGGWWWDGAPALIDGVSQAKAPLQADSIIQLGTYQFKFFDRARHRSHAVPPLPAAISVGTASNSVATATTTPATPPPAWATFVPGGSNGAQNTDPAVPVSQTPTPPNHFATTPPRTPPRSMPPTMPPTAGAPTIASAPATIPAPSNVSTPASVPGHQLGITPMDALHRSFSFSSAVRATVGRASSNDWVISDSTVSGQHALLTLEGSTLTIRDLDSTNGTFVNGQKLEPNEPMPLYDGYRVKLGQVECLVRRK